MYVDPFWAGVFATLFAEAVVIIIAIIAGFITSVKNKKTGGKG